MRVADNQEAFFTMPDMRLEIVTAERVVYSEDIDVLVAPGGGWRVGDPPQSRPPADHAEPGRDKGDRERRGDIYVRQRRLPRSAGATG